MNNESETWKTVPLRSVILEALYQRHGLITERDLQKYLKREYGYYSSTELNKALMSLENMGLIYVSWLTKTERRIQLIDKDMNFIAVGED